MFNRPAHCAVLQARTCGPTFLGAIGEELDDVSTYVESGMLSPVGLDKRWSVFTHIRPKGGLSATEAV